MTRPTRGQRAAVAALLYLVAIVQPRTAMAAVLGETSEKSVVFLFDDRADHGVTCPWPVTNDCGLRADCRTGTYCPLGTAFLTGFQDKENPKRTHAFLVTAQHVIADLPSEQAIAARLTTGSDEPILTLDRSAWRFASDPKAGLAIYMRPLPTEKTLGTPTKQYATERLLREKGVTVGDAIFTLGLVPALVGNRRNYPVARQGTLALLATDDALPGAGRWYFAEAQTYEGSSGGPVFLSLGGLRRGTLTLGQQVYLIGVNQAFMNRSPQMALMNVGLQGFTRVDVLLKMMCEPEVLKGVPPSADISDCASP